MEADGPTTIETPFQLPDDPEAVRSIGSLAMRIQTAPTGNPCPETTVILKDGAGERELWNVNQGMIALVSAVQADQHENLTICITGPERVIGKWMGTLHDEILRRFAALES